MLNVFESLLRFLFVSLVFFSLVEAMDTEEIKKRNVPPPSPCTVTYSCYEFLLEESGTLEIRQITQDHKEQEDSASNKPAAFHTTPLSSISFDALAYFLIIPKNAIYICNSSPLFRGTSSDSPDLLDLPRYLFCEGTMTIKFEHGANFATDIVSSSSKNVSITVQDKTLFTSFSQHFSLGIGKYIEEKDLGIFLLLDANYLSKQLGYMQRSNPIINEAIKIFTSTTQVQLDEMLGVANTQSELALPQMLGLALIEEAREVTYTGVDNLLFAKAYTHMTHILQKILLTPEHLINPNAPSVSAVRQLFCTKKPYLMAMITFLTTCHQAAASEEQKHISKSLDIPTEELLSANPLMRQAFPTTSLADPPKEDDTPIEELFRLLNVVNQEEFFALESDEFDSRLNRIVLERDQNRLIKLYVHHQVQIKKQKRQEETLKRRAAEQEYLKNFYEKGRFTNLRKNEHGHILSGEFVFPEEEKDSK